MAIRKEIVSESKRRLGDRLERSRAEHVSNLRQERERNDGLLRPDGDADVTNAEQQAGRLLHRSELMRRLGKLNPNLWYERSLRYPAQGGIYVKDDRSPYGKRMVSALPHERVPEFSMPLTVPDVIPDTTVALHWQTIRRVESKVPGWRTVLLKLAMEGLITPSGIEEQFQITRGRSSQKWQQAMT